MTDLALTAPAEYGRSFRRYRTAGLALILAFGVGFGAWSAMAPLASAVIAVGRIDVDGSVKSVQHETGGTVSEILVSEGSSVVEGQPLLRLDATGARAGLEIFASKLDELWMAASRLKAERDGAGTMELPAFFAGREGEPVVVALFNTEQRLFTVRLAARTSQKDQLGARIGQLESQISGLKTQQAAKAHELALSATDLDGAHSLLGKGLAAQSRVNDLERAHARLEGEAGELAAALAEIEGRITETKLQILGIDQAAIADAGRELNDTTSAIAELAQRRIAAAEQLRRTEVTAPTDGVVHQLAVHTIGGVVGAGEVLMTIVPSSGTLTIEARISPVDIEGVHPGQEATIRLPGLNHATTPELAATVRRIGADLTEDQAMRVAYYPITLDLAPGEADKLRDTVLVPGMPVEAFIAGEPRTFLDYLTQPFRDRLPHALREQ